MFLLLTLILKLIHRYWQSRAAGDKVKTHGIEPFSGLHQAEQLPDGVLLHWTKRM